MTYEIKHGTHGIPLTILSKSEYEPWLESQTEFIQNWLRSTQFKGKGHRLISNSNGELCHAVYVCENKDAFFACGDLSGLLPEGEYHYHPAGKEAQIKVAVNWALGSYQFNKFKHSDRETRIKTLVLSDEAAVKQANHMIEGIFLTRDLINTPASHMMPEHLSEQTQNLAKRFTATFNEIVGDELLQKNFPTIHAVGRASVHTPRLLDLEWGDKNHPRVTLVGKGVCFDSGGLDLKPSSAMRLMKKDMGGAAHVLGLASIIMANKLPVRLRVLIPAVENAVSANAFRPGDVITTRSGQTVEIDNTDAEGRLVLCDALDLASEEKPEIIIDYATLTGACRVALGTELPGFFCNDDTVASQIAQSGLDSEDPVWQLPLHKAYKDLLKSDVADMTNCSTTPFGGAITAALYLESFIKHDTPWVHFDVMAWNNRKLAGRPVGGEAMGVRAIYRYLSQRYS